MIDVFVSYAGEDVVWARTLARKFIESGLTVFFDEWNVRPGDVVLHRLDEAIRDSMSCVAVVSPALFRSPRAMEEHAALMGRDIRFIPVLIGDAELPAFARGRVWRDFRGVAGEDYDAKVDELIDTILGRAEESSAPENLQAALPSPPRPLTCPEQDSFVVCHVGADHDYALRLVLQLRGAGLPVWWLGSLEPGDLQFWQIRRQLRHAVGVIVLMSPQSQDSDDITRMIIEGELHARHFIPILLHGQRNYHLAHTWYVDARDGRLLGDDELAILRRLHQAHTAGRPLEPGSVLPAPLATPPVRALRLPPAASLARLDGMLKAEDYRHADLLTTSILLEAADRLEEGWLAEHHGAALPYHLLSGIDALWAEHTHGRHGFRVQVERVKVRMGLDIEFLRQQLAYGWRASERAKMPRHYRDFAARSACSGFFPTLRNPQNEKFFDWYEQWAATVLAVHLRLRAWEETT
ncbi:toll/interleukin-1 receptor domain-containing protein [Nonomuraea sp. H19]|uniref:toll/interleukin-1 receptor domain-containing protein n=1 Tax=Nonomuraea sp. H19 TaxID=3452206 RepID=UPI003F8AD89C